MQLKSLSLASMLLVASTSASASFIKMLNDDEQSTYHLSKYCVNERRAKNRIARCMDWSEYVEYHDGF